MDNSRYKFRAWDTEYEKMTIAYTLDELLANAHPLHRVVQGDYIWRQFTNRTDSEGEEIYEGDLIELPYVWDEKYWKVELTHGCWYLSHGDRLSLLCNFKASEIKIIGNIYENPELLNGT